MEYINNNGDFNNVRTSLDPREVGSLGVEAYFSIDTCSLTGSGSGDKGLKDAVDKENKRAEDADKERRGQIKTSK